MTCNHWKFSTWLIGLVILSWSCVQEESPQIRPLVSFVNPFIGTAGEGNTFPGAVLPWGMASVSPINVDKYQPGYHPVGYKYGQPYIYGFSHVNLSGVGCKDMGSILLMPTTGELRLDSMVFRSGYSQEKARPGYYSVRLDHTQIDVRVTATERTGLSSYEFPQSNGNLVLDLGRSVSDRKGAFLKKLSSTEFVGYKDDGGFCAQGNEHRVYFALRFSQPVRESRFWSDNEQVLEDSLEGEQIGGWFSFDLKNRKLLAQVGISYVSIAHAQLNLSQEQQGFDFERTLTEGQQKWEETLRHVMVSGQEDESKTIFYTALYHALIHPSVMSDVDGSYPMMGANGKVGRYPDGQLRYSVFSLWDTYRTVHPLLSLLFPDRQLDMVRTMVDMYKESGWLPKWELGAQESLVMVGDPASIVIADTYLRGLTDFDAEKALEGMLKSAILQDSVKNRLRPALRFYETYGYIPNDDKGDDPVWGSVSTSLEYYLADWSVAQLAGKLGQNEHADQLYHRSMQYKQLYDAEVGFLRPKLASGQFMEPFDPETENGELPWRNSGGPGFVEGSAWQYTWFVPHDIEGLKQLMGGNELFVNHLQRAFDEDHFVLWNEPDMAYPYLFNYVKGQEWRTQRTVRESIQRYFHNSPGGLPGNDDCGTLSGWVLWSMMGLYPACPASGRYELTSPYFEEISLLLDNRFYPGKELTITADHPRSSMFIDTISWNRRIRSSFSIEHQELTKGGSLKFGLTNKPPDSELRSKIAGMIYGTLIGDAAGGPPEFRGAILRSDLGRKEAALTNDEIEKLAERFQLSAYPWDVGMFGVWEKKAPPGSVTDDSRWKMITLNALKKSVVPDKEDFLTAVDEYPGQVPPKYKGYAEKWLSEYRLSFSGQLPDDRLWGGVPTLMGQMTFAPLSGLYPYHLHEGYQAIWSINPFDHAQSLDINTAVLVGLAKALEKDATLDAAITAIARTDPHRFQNVPWTKRRMQVWLDSAERFVERAEGSPAKLFRMLDDRLEARQGWDAWVPIVVFLSCAKLTKENPLATLQLTLEYGADTDSYAQLAGAYMGALHGVDIFPESMRSIVRKQLREDYGVDPEEWVELVYQRYHEVNVD